jgi:hypothetical protein
VLLLQYMPKEAAAMGSLKELLQDGIESDSESDINSEASEEDRSGDITRHCR